MATDDDTPGYRPRMAWAITKLALIVLAFGVLLVLAADQRHDCTTAGGHLEKTGRYTNHCVNDHGTEIHN